MILPESPGAGRLGRHVHFDDRSRAYRVTVPSAPLVSKTWSRRVAAFDQGDTGSCTGNAIAGLLATVPFRAKGRKITETTARALYGLATSLDDIPGAYPPDDTGSSVLAACKAAVALGYAASYRWCFGLDDVLKTLAHVGPVAIGVSWYEGFDVPAADGTILLSGQVRGGHAIELLGIDVPRGQVVGENSWGSAWGWRGRFRLAWVDLDRLLREQGEAVTFGAGA